MKYLALGIIFGLGMVDMKVCSPLFFYCSSSCFGPSTALCHEVTHSWLLSISVCFSRFDILNLRGYKYIAKGIYPCSSYCEYLFLSLLQKCMVHNLLRFVSCIRNNAKLPTFVFIIDTLYNSHAYLLH